MVIGAGLVFWKSKVGGHYGSDKLTKVTKEEMQLLIKDFNPMQLKMLSETPEQKKKLAEELEQLLAIASEAKKEGLDKEGYIKSELESMEKAILAINYDQKINKDKGNLPPFSFIKEDQVKEFWNGGPEGGTISGFFNKARAARRASQFDAFIDAKLELAGKRGQLPPGQKPSEDELKQAKEAFAKTRIYYNEAMEKWDELDEDFKKSVELQTKLQQAQFLTQVYVQDVLAKKLEVSDEEVEKYIKENPDITKTKEKKAKADEVIAKLKSGGDFAELAKEYSEDPGSKDKGGLYEGVTVGQFAPEFEKAALALKPGEYTAEPVKTKFGFHVIKLIKKGESEGPGGKNQPNYDVRHILISTMIKDPENPLARDTPVEDFVKQKLEQEKQKKILEDIKKNNKIEVAKDFEIPKPSEEEIKRMQEQQQQQLQQQIEQMQKQQGGQAPPPPSAPEPKEPKK
jgi:foldase protein PrsA